MTLVVLLQEDEDVPSVYRNLKIFCETADKNRSVCTWHNNVTADVKFIGYNKTSR